MAEIETLKDLVQWQADVNTLLKELRRADRQLAVWETKRRDVIDQLTKLGAPLTQVVDFATIEYVNPEQQEQE